MSFEDRSAIDGFGSGFVAIFTRDLTLYFRNRGAWLNPLLFALLVITLFTFGIGPDATALAENAGAIVWVVALLSIMLSLDALFRDDYADGSLEQMLLAPGSIYLTVLAKVIAYWLMTGLPLVIATPLFALMLGLPVFILPVLSMGLLLGTGILSFIGAIGAALTLSLRTANALIALLILPLYVPVVIFGAQLIQYRLDDWSVVSPLAMLAGLFIGALALAPLAIAAGLRMSVDD